MSHIEWLRKVEAQLRELHARDVAAVRSAEVRLAESRGYLQAVLDRRADLRMLLAEAGDEG